ncbi:hypothetical protein CMO88_02175 [Candidatus Woesearchaeota archaeon]|nr:hypothetical protein [Candidatus Woesearchaeota archaeon]
MISDTTFLIDLSRGDNGAFKKLRELKKRKEPLTTTVITQYELWRGRGGLTDKERHVIGNVVDNSLIISLEFDSAKLAGIINNKLRKAGITVGSRDCLIAGITIAGGDTLLTRNIKDFSRIEGIQLETY